MIFINDDYILKLYITLQIQFKDYITTSSENISNKQIHIY